MTAVDTSREAVEVIVARIHGETNGGGLLRWCDPRVANEAAALLRALLDRAERAEEQRRIGHVSLDKLMQEHLEMIARAEAAEREEREACAALLMRKATHGKGGWQSGMVDAAAAIRARGEGGSDAV